MDTNQHQYIRKAAILGAGVMGAQIAAHLVNAGIATILFDLPSPTGNKNELSINAIKRLSKLKPLPLTRADNINYIIAANYEQNLNLLSNCDLIIEAGPENFKIKADLYQKIIPYLSDKALLASNTSGLSIAQLSSTLPKSMQQRFCGIHFFNPPRYMHLVEVIPSQETSPQILQFLEDFLVSTLGKGVVIAKDTPNFIANRIGVFSSLSIFYHTVQFGLGFDLVDSLTGLLIGRAKSATYRTADIVGLDTMVHVIKNMGESVANDPWLHLFTVPDWLNLLISQGALGQKTQAGIYKKEGKVIKVLELATGHYRPQTQMLDNEILLILKNQDWGFKLKQLRESIHPQGQFLWAVFRDLFHYCAYHAASIADTVRDIDLAMRWGYGWQQGPFEIWQMADWQQITQWIVDDINAHKTLVPVALPAWVADPDRTGVYSTSGAFAPGESAMKPRSKLSVYKRQLYPNTVLGEVYDEGTTLYETDAVRLWHLSDDIGILNFKSKKNTISNAVLEGILTAVDLAEKQCSGLILWQRQGDNFSYGADLRQFSEQSQTGQGQFLEKALSLFQQTALKLRYCMIPTVAAIKGMAFGGGCELPLHCDRIVAAMETYMGLVEMGVGLLPAGGGTKEMALRAAKEAKEKDVFDFLANRFKLIAGAEVSTSAADAMDKGFLRATDIMVQNANELLYVAKQQVQALAEAGYRPPLPPLFKAAGKAGIATLKSALVNLHEGGFISEYDYYLAGKVAEVICGGYIDTHSIIDEKWILRLEIAAFLELALEPKTQERIQYTLANGKPLRN